MPALSPYEIFQSMFRQGYTLAATAAAVGISRRTASRWRKSPPGQRGRRARPDARRLRVALVVRIASRTITRDHRTIPAFPSTGRVAAQLAREFRIRVSRHTVRRDLASRGWRTLVRPRHPNLRDAGKRLTFARLWMNCDARKIVFSDEHFVSTNDNTLRTMLVGPGERPLPREVQRRQNVPNFQIWAAIGYGWRSELVIFPKKDPTDDRKMAGGFRLDSHGYTRRCLSKIRQHLCEHQLVFMQDGARCHWARNVRAYLDRNRIRVMEGYPASSPDLNPIESVWAMLDRRIAEMLPQTDVELLAAARRAWREIPQADIDAQVLSFSARLYGVAATRGL